MNILFVCTGNTCRSPMAEAIARRMAAERGLSQVRVTSAGTDTLGGLPASEGSLLVGIERQLDLSSHRARQLTAQMVAESDLVLTMGQSHIDRVLQLGGKGKTYLLSQYASHGALSHPISDPFGGSLEGYRDIASALERELALVFDRLAADARKSR